MGEQLMLLENGKTGLAEGRFPWGEAHPGRGLSYHQLAMDFIEKFPPGKTLSSHEFDEWAESHELLKVPTAKIGSNARKGHVLTRHEVRTKLAKALNHPRIAESGMT